jgi:pimeloyl-ACP methyl ester carboxylesterase
MSDNGQTPFEKLVIDGVTIELARAGEGPTLLFLHSVDGIDPSARWFELLAERFHVIAPWHPGFGHSELPPEFRSVDDLALFYLELARELEIAEATLVGVSFGGWLAAEIAVRSTAPFARLALVDPLGIKIGDRESRDIADIYAMSQEELTAHAYHDPSRRSRDYSTMSERERLAIARSREAYTYFGWRPYMHDPSLRRWLRRIRIPTLVAWGASDRIATPEYGRAYAAAIPDARFELIDGAGHYPHIEQPDRLAELVLEHAGLDAPLPTAG